MVQLSNKGEKMSHLLIFPKVAALELTYKCNHKCLFCSCPWESSEMYRENELTAEQWFFAVDELMRKGVSSFTLTGGEPLMREDLMQIIDYILKKGASLNLISNGRNIDDNFLDLIAERDISICISIPSCYLLILKTY